jgi:hypothetical protein
LLIAFGVGRLPFSSVKTRPPVSSYAAPHESRSCAWVFRHALSAVTVC